LQYGAFVIAAGAFLIMFSVLARMHTWPQRPDVLHTVPFNNHGTTVYMPPLQGELHDLCFWIGFCCIWIGVIAGYAERRMSR
jgi:hypothetical protein